MALLQICNYIPLGTVLEQISEDLQDQVVTQGDTVTFTCTVLVHSDLTRLMIVLI